MYCGDDMDEVIPAPSADGKFIHIYYGETIVANHDKKIVVLGRVRFTRQVLLQIKGVFINGLWIYLRMQWKL